MKIILVLLISSILIPISFTDAHRDGCHSWHSCPSDTGSYTCGDKGYYSECPSQPSKETKPSTGFSTPKTTEFEKEERIPSWIKNVAGWWADDITSKADFVNSVRYLIDNDVIKVKDTIVSSNMSQEIPVWIKNTAKWWSQGNIGDDEFLSGIQWMIENGIMSVYGKDDQSACSGEKMCIEDVVQRVIDGDTLIIGKYIVRLSLIDTPEKDELGFKEATAFTSKMCTLGKTVTLDQDDLQPTDKYGRIVGVITCSGNNLNEELLTSGHTNILTQYCQKSEFKNESWVKQYGC